jgi:TolB-like protein
LSHFRFEHFELVPALRQVRVNGQVVPLGGRAYDLLLVLVEHRDRVVGKDELLTRVWPGQVVEENNLTVQIAALRKAIGSEAIATVSGRGYRFAAREVPETSTAAASPARISADALERHTLALPNVPSIAVLPFDNLSGDPSQDYFADGMVEDLITALARMKAFFVIARNSSFVYKVRAVDIKTVGRELGVRYVLEGSVRKAGGRLRITGQLIDASDGHHVWAERFDGGQDDIFALQDQITDAAPSSSARACYRLPTCRPTTWAGGPWPSSGRTPRARTTTRPSRWWRVPCSWIRVSPEPGPWAHWPA